MKKINCWLGAYLLLSAPFVFQACKQNTKPEKVDILSANIDTTINPGEDFFMYANGLWIKNNPIPNSEASWNIGHMVQNDIYAKLKSINEEAASNKAQAGSNQQKIGDFYAIGMDSTTADQQGLMPLQDELNAINKIATAQQVLNVAAMQMQIGAGGMLGIGAQQDSKKSDQMALYIWQGGLGLPNRDYYFNNDSRTQKIRSEYQAHIYKMLKLTGEDSITASKNAKAVYALESNLAKVSRKLEDLRDPYTNYNKMSLKQLNKFAPNIEWTAWLKNMGITGVDSVIVGQPEFVKALAAQIKSSPVATWKEYLKWHLVSNFASELSSSFDNEDFHFYGTVLQGKTQQRPRWKRVLDNEEAAMGEILGQLFVKDYFNENTKKRYENLVDNVVLTFEEHIKNLDWMSDSTKQKALSKLHHISKKVGYPDKWKDFSSLRIDRTSYAGNIKRANQFWYKYNINKLGKPVDRTEWDMTPQTYNAYYNPSNNEIVLPAAIFSIPGIKDEDADDALIYGYAGASTIGHELTHGFDDEGRQFDENGNLRSWWKAKDEELFKNKVQGIVKQFDSYSVLDSMHVNGKATAGENIADLGGIVIGLDAFKKTEQYKKGEKIGGLTPLQRYFLGYSLGWLGHQRNERLAQQILTDVHAPANLRVNGPFANVPEFYEAFHIDQKSKMWKNDSDRVKIW